MTIGDAIVFALLSLAVFRLCVLIISDEGPASIFDRARMHWRIPERNTWWRRGLQCVSCISFWLGLGAGVAWWGLNATGIVAGLGISAVSILLMRRM
jgi:hypothetical protein